MIRTSPISGIKTIKEDHFSWKRTQQSQSGTDTLVGLATTDSLTNKTLSGTSNTIEANKIGQGASAVTISGSAVAGYVLKATTTSAATWQASETANVGTATTSDGTVTASLTISTAANTTYFISARTVGRRTDAGTESCASIIRAAFRRDATAASLTQFGADDVLSFEDTPAWNVTSFADTATGNILIRVTGEVGKTIKWSTTAEVDSVAT